MTFITRGGEGLEDKNKDRKATRSEGMGLEESASRALIRTGWRSKTPLASGSFIFSRTTVTALSAFVSRSHRIYAPGLSHRDFRIKPTHNQKMTVSSAVLPTTIPTNDI